jgi:hypothetical protein
MNRAERRLFESRNRTLFRGELSRRQDDAAYREVLRRNMTEEANGRPIPPEIAAGMTKPRETEDLYQIGVTVKGTGAVTFLGPMMGADALGMAVETINRQILTGQRDDWTHAEAYPMTRVQEMAP